MGQSVASTHASMCIAYIRAMYILVAELIMGNKDAYKIMAAADVPAVLVSSRAGERSTAARRTRPAR